MVTRTRDRAQLILVGALLVALVIIGLAFVLNSVVFTQSLDTTGGTTEAGAAADFDDTVSRDTRSLLIRVNHGGLYDSPATLDGSVRSNYTDYSGLVTETYASQRGVFADATYNDATVVGYRTVQAEDGAFTDDSGGANWSLVTTSDKRQLGWFVVNLNASEMEQDPMVVELVGADGNSRELAFRQNASSDSRVDVVSKLNGGSGSLETCTASRERVLLDLLEGEAVVGNCSFDTTEGLSSPFAVRIGDGDRAIGSYELVTREQGTVTTPCPGGGSSDPCLTRVVWQANVTTVYDSERITYRHTGNVTIYDTP